MKETADDHRARVDADAGSVVLVLSTLALPIFLWLVPASIHFVGWDAAGLERVALLPGLQTLLWGITSASLAAGLLMIVRSRGRCRIAVTCLAPLALLWLCALPFIPWLPDRFPLLLILHGPLRWLVAATAVLGFVLAASASWRARINVAQPGAAAVFAISLLVYIVGGWFVTAAIRTGGDEPHYLVITQSLLRDGDLRVENNYRQSDYRAFFDGELRPDYRRRGVNGVIYSIHPPALPTLLVPAYALGGYRGAMIAMCFLAALGTLIVFKVADALGGRFAACFTWLAYAFSVPTGVMSWMIYPEVPAALLTAAFTLWLLKPPPRRASTWFVRGLCLASFPWLHTKFLPLFIGIVLCLLVKIWRRPAHMTALLGPMAVSVGLWLFAFFRMYGVLDPFVPYGSLEQTQLSNWNVPRGVLGLLLDQEFGLLIYSPVYLLVVPGFWWMVRRPASRWYALPLAGCVGIFVLGVTRSYMWWGGSSPPARFLAPVLPLLAPMIATAVRDLRPSRPLATSVLLMTLVTFAYLVTNPGLRMIVQNRNGVGAMVEQLQVDAPLTRALPSFVGRDWIAQIPVALPWIAALLLGWLAARHIGRRFQAATPLSTYWPGTAGIVVALLAGCLFGSVVIPVAAHLAAANESRLSLMDHYDPPRLHPFDFRTLRVMDDQRLLERVAVDVVAHRFSTGEPLLIAGPVWLPAGRYEVTTWFRTTRPSRGSLVVYDGNQSHAQFAEALGPLSSPARLIFELPTAVTRVRVDVSSPELAQQVTRTELRPLWLVARSARPDVKGVRAVSQLASRPGAYVFFLDDHTYPEGEFNWTSGGQQSAVLVAPAGASALRVTLLGGISGGSVSLTVGGMKTDVRLAPRETRAIQVPVAPGTQWLPLAIASEGGFRPSEVETGSTDTRWLGCRFSIALVAS